MKVCRKEQQDDSPEKAVDLPELEVRDFNCSQFPVHPDPDKKGRSLLVGAWRVPLDRFWSCVSVVSTMLDSRTPLGHIEPWEISQDHFIPYWANLSI